MAVRPGPTYTRTKQAASDEHTLTRKGMGMPGRVNATNRWMDGWEKDLAICVQYVLGINSPEKLTVQGQQGPGRQGECIISSVQMTIDWNWKSACMWASAPADRGSGAASLWPQKRSRDRRAWPPRALDRRRRRREMNTSRVFKLTVTFCYKI